MTKPKKIERGQVAARLRELAQRVEDGEIPLLALLFFDPQLLLVEDPPWTMQKNIEIGEVRSFVAAQGADDPAPARAGHYTEMLNELETLRKLIRAF
jgi:hypothetical protein